MIKEKVNAFLKQVESDLKKEYPEELNGMNDAMINQLVRLTTTYYCHLDPPMDEAQLIRDNARAVRDAFHRLRVKVVLEGLEEQVYRVFEVPMMLTLDQFCKVLLASVRADLSHLYQIHVKGKTFYCTEDEEAVYREGYEPIDEVCLAELDLKKRNKMTMVYDYGEEYVFSITVQDVIQTETMPLLEEMRLLEGNGFGIWEDNHYLMEMYYQDPMGFERELKKMNRKEVEAYLPLHEEFDREDTEIGMKLVLGCIPEGIDFDDEDDDFGGLLS